MTESLLSAMDKKVEATYLLAFYGALLTENQQEMMRLHYEEDFTLAEIAQQAGVSRQSVHDTLQRALLVLTQFEEKLGLFDRFQKTEEKIDQCLEALERVEASETTKPYLTSAVAALHALKGEEEKE